jgi:hypothetical protein
MNEKPPTVLAAIGLALLCGAGAAVVALIELGTCFRETGDSASPDIKVSAACASTSAKDIFNAGLIVAVVIAGIGAIAAYIAHSRRILLASTGVSLALIVVLAIWGFALKATVTSMIGPM